MEHHLGALRFVPSILKLQHILIERFQRKLNRAEASSFTIKQLLDDFRSEGTDVVLKELIEDFQEAWMCVKEGIMGYSIKSETGIINLSDEVCSKRIQDESGIGVLLPCLKGEGLCSYMLLDFLLSRQNDFLNSESVQKSFQNWYTVSVRDLKPSHLVMYHPDKDICPMILENCNYSFKVGEGTSIEYDFLRFQRQLRDRFLCAKCKIDTKDIPMMTYRSDTTDAVVLKQLREQIHQEPLEKGVQQQICSEFRDFPELYDCIDNLDITINFLKILGGDSEEELQHFMCEKLKMTDPIWSIKARKICKLKNVEALWLCLSFEKTKRLAEHKKNAFENVDDKLKMELEVFDENKLNTYTGRLSVDKLQLLLELVFSCIVFDIGTRLSSDDLDSFDITKLSLSNALHDHLQEQIDRSESLPTERKPRLLVLEHLKGFPRDIDVCKVVTVWNNLFDVIQKRQAC